ncbi:MAG TPA: inositol monophosphatase family protein [Candidatus Limnocylindria bacterium]|jgi:myo-inositol-1(or 4)-monophosphatase|nr:inositol monophosphatase family protein [Candidatus Limnocylindria bacterium]
MTEGAAQIARDSAALTATEALEIAIGAARAAAALLVERFGGPAAGLRAKSSEVDMVSEADVGAERAVVTYIRERRPDDALVAEEGSQTAGRSGIQWYIDPLDGTTNYLYGVPHWAVAICCADAHGALAGVVYDPLRDELFSALRAGGARVGDRRLATTTKADLATALVATGFGYGAAQRETQGRILARVAGEVRDVRRFGSASLDLAYVAAGRWDAYFESVDKPWDWMAGALLVREAGGRVSELTPADPALPRIVASGLALHEPLLALLAKATVGL